MLALAANPPSPLAEKKLTLHDSDGTSIMFTKHSESEIIDQALMQH